LLTDAVIDGKHSLGKIALSNLTSLIESNSSASLDTLTAAVMSGVMTSCESRPVDDIVLLLVRIPSPWLI
jgi:hypothetical protein